ncbi:MAG: hypothetical protein IT457_05195 [Planctomycetes bacterium]|nr:hypothetical protein [Planctomycetota bacterium]
MSSRPPSPLQLVLVPAVLTLLLTVVRLVGEINGWNPTLFGKPEAGGSQALLGISWLIVVFGLWFGIRLQRGGAGPKSKGRAVLLSLLAVGILAGGMFGLQALDLMWIPDEEHPGEVRGLMWMNGLLVVAVLVAAIAFGRAALTLFLYGLLARIPVVAVTYIAFGQETWNTHYTKIPPFFTNVAEADRLMFLVMPQITFWPALTIVMGTLMASLGAAMTRARTSI